MDIPMTGVPGHLRMLAYAAEDNFEDAKGCIE